MSKKKTNEAIGERINIRSRLGLLGWTSVSHWSRAHGYSRSTVYSAMRNWGTRTDRAPHGRITMAALSDLRTTLAEERRPVVVKALLDDGTEVMGQSGGLFAGHEETRMAA